MLSPQLRTRGPLPGPGPGGSPNSVNARAGGQILIAIVHQRHGDPKRQRHRGKVDEPNVAHASAHSKEGLRFNSSMSRELEKDLSQCSEYTASQSPMPVLTRFLKPGAKQSLGTVKRPSFSLINQALGPQWTWTGFVLASICQHAIWGIPFLETPISRGLGAP